MMICLLGRSCGKDDFHGSMNSIWSMFKPQCCMPFILNEFHNTQFKAERILPVHGIREGFR